MRPREGSYYGALLHLRLELWGGFWLSNLTGLYNSGLLVSFLSTIGNFGNLQ